MITQSLPYQNPMIRYTYIATDNQAKMLQIRFEASPYF